MNVRRLIQFRLRTVLIAVAIVALVLKLLEPYYNQHLVASRAAEMGGWVLTEPILPEWCPGNLYRVREIGFYTPITDASFGKLVETRGVEQVKRLGFYQSNFSPANVAKLERFRSCEFLQFIECNITDAEVIHFQNMPALRTVILNRTHCTPFGTKLIKSKAHSHGLKIVAS